MKSLLTDTGLELLAIKLKSGEYDGMDIMRAWLAIEGLIYLRGSGDYAP